MEICGPEPYRPEPEPSGDRGDGGQSDIDLSLPITSTYLRKMRCGGTDMMQFWSTTPQQVSQICTYFTLSKIDVSISYSKSSYGVKHIKNRYIYFCHFAVFITSFEDNYLHLKGCFCKNENCLFIQQTFYLISQEMELRTFSQLVSSHFPFHFSWDSYNLHYCCFRVGRIIVKKRCKVSVSAQVLVRILPISKH